MSTRKTTILLVEDDLNLGLLIMDLLEDEGYQVKLCKDGESALNSFQKDTYSLCLLDVMLPKIDGFTIANEIREKDKKIPIIFITAKSLKEDKLKAYSLGADDFIVKPFDEEELIWKIKAILKRIPETQKVVVEPIHIGKFTFDFENQNLILANKSKRITVKESELLLYLVRKQNKILKREEILTDVWGENDYFLGRSLDVFITKLRKYLKDDPSIKIENVFNVGFVFKVKDGSDE